MSDLFKYKGYNGTVKYSDSDKVPLGKVIAWYLKKIPEKVTDVEQLFGTLPNDIDLDDVRMASTMCHLKLYKISG